MNRTATKAYCTVVILGLLGVAAFLGWNDYTIWKNTTSEFRKKTDEYASELSRVLVSSRNVQEEIAFSENLLKQDERLVAVQAMSDNYELRFSTVLPIADAYAYKPLGMDEELNDFPDKWRYMVLDYPIEAMPGLKVYFMGVMLTIAEIRQTIIILLATAGGFFVLTCLLILFTPGKAKEHVPTVKPERPPVVKEHVPPPPVAPEVSNDEIFFLDSEEAPISSAEEKLLDALNQELENADYTGLDVSLAILDFNQNGESAIHSFWQNGEFFPLSNNKYGIIEIGQSWRGMMTIVKNFVTNLDKRYSVRAGITSKNTRGIEGTDLLFEAESALAKTSHSKNIAGFHANPEKYREYRDSAETAF